MPLTSGTRLGPYEIVAALGAGGMGEVYRARDTRLDRTVAIKVLPAALAADAQFRERFDREARSISALDHPNICAVYDVGHDGGLDFIVMAFVEGETLAARLERGPLKLDDTLRYAMEIASALEQAHRAGIVHRDVKPGNVMLTTSGTGSTTAPQAKLLDFGLAKRAGPAAAGGFTAMPTTPAELTAAGAILGTFQYMAPEQLEGEDADARSDIFAFGAVVYEMVTGRKAFEARSRASLISAILRDEPLPLAADSRTRGLDRVIRRCLAKNPNDRWQTASDLLEALRWVRDGSGQDLDAAASRPRARVREPIAWALALALAAFAAWLWMTPTVSPPVVRLSIAMPRDVMLGTGVAFAPDRSTVVFAATQGGTARLYRRRIDQLEAVPIRGSEGGEFPFFSPDGKWVGFFASNTIRKVPVDGGPPSTLVRTEGFRRGGAWGVDDAIVFATDASPDLMRVPAAGGQPTVAVSAKLFSGATALRWPSWRLDGSAILFTVWAGALETARVGAYSIQSGQGRIVADGASPHGLGRGDLLFGRGDSLWTVSMDWKDLKATSAPVPVLEGVIVNIGGSGFYAVAGDGSLAYVSGRAGSNWSVAWITRDGQRQSVLDKPQTYANPRLSPNGRRVVLQVAATDADEDLWLYDIDTKVLSRLTFGVGRDTNPVWTPDGRRIVFAHGTGSGVRNLHWIATDGAGVMERLSDSPRMQMPFDVSPDGRTLMFGQLNDQGRTELWTLPLAGDRKPQIYLQAVGTLRADAGASDGNARFSPDGRWIAYQSNEAGPIEVYVRPFPGPGGKWQVSSGGGQSPVWAPNGKELFFRAPSSMTAVDVQVGASFGNGTPRQLFTYNFPVFSDYSVAADGGRFLMVLDAAAATSPEVRVALNWADELKRRTSGAR